MKEFLKKLLAKRETELKITQARFDKSTDETEIRALGETLATLKAEIEDIEKQLNEAEDNGEGAEGSEGQGHILCSPRSLPRESPCSRDRRLWRPRRRIRTAGLPGSG